MESKRQEIERKIGELRIKLTSNTSEIGDWKIAKCTEAFIAGEAMPYDFEKLKADRQEARAEINRLEEELLVTVDEPVIFDEPEYTSMPDGWEPGQED